MRNCFLGSKTWWVYEGEPMAMVWRRREAWVKKGTKDGHGNVYFSHFITFFIDYGYAMFLVYWALLLPRHMARSLCFFDSMWL